MLRVAPPSCPRGTLLIAPSCGGDQFHPFQEFLKLRIIADAVPAAINPEVNQVVVVFPICPLQPIHNLRLIVETGVATSNAGRVNRSLFTSLEQYLMPLL